MSLNPVSEPMLSPAQLARRLGVARNTIYDLIERGEIPAHRIGGQWRTTEQQFADFMDDNIHNRVPEVA